MNPILHDQAQNIFNSLKQTGDTAPAFHASSTYVITLFMRKYKFILCLYSYAWFGPVRILYLQSGPKNIATPRFTDTTLLLAVAPTCLNVATNFIFGMQTPTVQIQVLM